MTAAHNEQIPPRGVAAWFVAAFGFFFAWVLRISPSVMIEPIMAEFAVGGALYIAGAAVYALQRPDPAPTVFGYHEIFHSIVVVAATVHFVALAAYVLPIAG